MTYYDAFITSPARIEGLLPAGHASGQECPASPLFPEGTAAYFAIRDAVESGRRQGVQVDWGSWAVLMTTEEIAAFLVEIVGPPGAYEARFDGGALQHLADRMRALRGFINELPPDGLFAVVGEEF